MRRLSYTKDEFIEALKNSCYITDLAKKLGVSRVALYYKLWDTDSVSYIQSVLSENRRCFLLFNYNNDEAVALAADKLWKV